MALTRMAGAVGLVGCCVLGACNGDGLGALGGGSDGAIAADAGAADVPDLIDLDRPCTAVAAGTYVQGGRHQFACSFVHFETELGEDVVLLREAVALPKLGVVVVFPHGGVVTNRLLTFDDLASASHVELNLNDRDWWSTEAPLSRSTVTLTQAVLGTIYSTFPGIAHGAVDAVLEPEGWWGEPSPPQVILHVDF